jgi:CHASE1-domain containing sensor protein
MVHRSLWRRVVDFPLVAMLIAIGLLIVGITIAYLVASLALPPIRLAVDHAALAQAAPRIGAPVAWESGYTGKGVTIAFIRLREQH